MMVYMNTSAKSNNERLRELVEASGLTQAVALTVFNRGLGPAAYSESSWKAFFASPDTTRFRPLKDDLLAHAEREFAKLQRKA
jgi:hypothetical protein